MDEPHLRVVTDSRIGLLQPLKKAKGTERGSLEFLHPELGAALRRVIVARQIRIITDANDQRVDTHVPALNLYQRHFATRLQRFPPGAKSLRINHGDGGYITRT